MYIHCFEWDCKILEGKILSLGYALLEKSGTLNSFVFNSKLILLFQEKLQNENNFLEASFSEGENELAISRNQICRILGPLHSSVTFGSVSQENGKHTSLRNCPFIRVLLKSGKVSPSLSTLVQSKLLSSFWSWEFLFFFHVYFL